MVQRESIKAASEVLVLGAPSATPLPGPTLPRRLMSIASPPASTRRMSSRQFARNSVTEMSMTESYMDISEHARPMVPGRKLPRPSEHIEDQGTASRKTLYDFGLVQSVRQQDPKEGKVS